MTVPCEEWAKMDRKKRALVAKTNMESLQTIAQQLAHMNWLTELRMEKEQG